MCLVSRSGQILFKFINSNPIVFCVQLEQLVIVQHVKLKISVIIDDE